jgi:two-component system response regulator VicR
MSDIKILVCENNHMVFLALRGALKNEKYSLHCASDGRQAIEIMRREAFDMLITEILLPFFSGLELISMIRSKMQSTMPILVLSMVNSPNTIDLACQLGASEYISKPFAPEKLKKRISALLLNKELNLRTLQGGDLSYNIQN